MIGMYVGLGLWFAMVALLVLHELRAGRADQ
jgi:hypothetical protein